MRIKRTRIEKFHSLDMAGKRRSDLMALVVVPFVTMSPSRLIVFNLHGPVLGQDQDTLKNKTSDKGLKV